MRFRLRGRKHFGPFYINYTQRGFTSWGIRLGPFTKNFTRGTSSIDTPGPGSLHFDRKGRQ